MMKVLFLDIDGVLNHDYFYSHLSEIKLAHNNYPYTEFDPKCVEELNRILDSTNAKLVVSSSWRVESNLQDIFTQVGIKHKIYGITPIYWDDKERTRGEEIEEYLNNNNVDTYCILDDVKDFTDEQMNNFVLCKSYDMGLTKKLADKAIEILNNNE